MTEGCLTKPDGKAAASTCGTHVGAMEPPSQALRPVKEEAVPGIPRGVYSFGLLGAKTGNSN
jgi:hypothetical protein